LQDSGPQDALNHLLEVLRDREGRIFVERELEAQRPTLEQIGIREHLSRERVRQLYERAKENLRTRLASPAAAIFRWRAHELHATLQNGFPADSPTVVSALSRACRGLQGGNETQQLMLWAAGPYRLRDGWLMKDGVEPPALPLSTELFGNGDEISIDRIRQW